MHRRSVAAVALGCALAVTGCGGGSSSTAASPAPAGVPGAASSGTTGPVSSGATGAVPVAVGAGSGAGFATLTTDAARRGLQITSRPVNSGAAAIPLLLSGQLQFTAADSVGALTAISRGVPIVIVALATAGGSSPADDATGILVKSGGAITSAKDLNGKKVAVNGIGNSAQLSAAAAIDKLGGDSRTVKFVEIPPPSLNAAVAAGTVDAAVTSEPGVSTGKAAGLRLVISPVSEVLPSTPLFVYVTSRKYLQQNRDTVLTFSRNMAQANAYADAHPDFVREFAGRSVQLTPDQLSKIILPRFVPTEVTKPALQKVVDLMLKYKTISSPVDLDKAVLNP